MWSIVSFKAQARAVFSPVSRAKVLLDQMGVIRINDPKKRMFKGRVILAKNVADSILETTAAWGHSPRKTPALLRSPDC